MVKYPPYVDAYGQLKELFKKIKEAAVPPKFNQDFLYTVLSLKSSSYRPMIPFLKRIGFLDDTNIPTQAYIDYRDESKSEFVMAEQVKKSYHQIFSAHTYANKLKKEEIISKLTSVLGTSKDDNVLPKIASTFLELCNLSNFEEEKHHLKLKETIKEPEKEMILQNKGNQIGEPTKLGISYTINLNLPPTSDIKVFDAIFKSLKENLLK